MIQSCDISEYTFIIIMKIIIEFDREILSEVIGHNCNQRIPNNITCVADVFIQIFGFLQPDF